MTRICFAAPLAIALLAMVTRPAIAARSPQEVEALVERAVTYIRDHGRQQAFADFSRPDGGFVDGELYVFCDDVAGTVLAHGGNPKLVGKNTLDVRDREGTHPAVEIFRASQIGGAGWVEYLWPNTAEGRVQRKVAYIVRIDDHTVCGSGYYMPDQK